MTASKMRQSRKKRQYKKLTTAIDWLKTLCHDTPLSHHHLSAPIKQLCNQAEKSLNQLDDEEQNTTLYLTIVLDNSIDAAVSELHWPNKDGASLTIKPFIYRTNQHNIIRSDSNQPDFELLMNQEDTPQTGFFEVPQIPFNDLDSLVAALKKPDDLLKDLNLFKEEKEKNSSKVQQLNENKLKAIQVNRAIQAIRLAIKLLNQFLDEEIERNRAIQLLNQDKTLALKQIINDEKNLKKHNKLLGDAISSSLIEQIATTREKIEQEFLEHNQAAKNNEHEKEELNPQEQTTTTNGKTEEAESIKPKDGKLTDENLTAWKKQQEKILLNTLAHFKDFQQQKFAQTMQTALLSQGIDQQNLSQVQISEPEILETQHKQFHRQIEIEKQALAYNDYSPEAWYLTAFKTLRSAPMQVALFASLLLVPALAWTLLLIESINNNNSCSFSSCPENLLTINSDYLSSIFLPLSYALIAWAFKSQFSKHRKLITPICLMLLLIAITVNISPFIDYLDNPEWNEYYFWGMVTLGLIGISLILRTKKNKILFMASLTFLVIAVVIKKGYLSIAFQEIHLFLNVQLLSPNTIFVILAVLAAVTWVFSLRCSNNRKYLITISVIFLVLSLSSQFLKYPDHLKREILQNIIKQKEDDFQCSHLSLIADSSNLLCKIPGVKEVVSGQKSQSTITELLKTSFPLILFLSVLFTLNERKSLRKKQINKAELDLDKKNLSLQKKILTSLVKAYQSQLKTSSPQLISNAIYIVASEKLRLQKLEIGKNTESAKASLVVNKQRLKQLEKLVQIASKNDQKLYELSLPESH